jgi:hypothetical protein
VCNIVVTVFKIPGHAKIPNLKKAKKTGIIGKGSPLMQHIALHWQVRDCPEFGPAKTVP